MVEVHAGPGYIDNAQAKQFGRADLRELLSNEENEALALFINHILEHTAVKFEKIFLRLEGDIKIGSISIYVAGDRVKAPFLHFNANALRNSSDGGKTIFEKEVSKRL